MGIDALAAGLVERSVVQVPRPFYDEPWPEHSAAAARAVWDWHLGLYHAGCNARRSDELRSAFAVDADRAINGTALEVLPKEVTRAAYEACQRHSLPRDLLAEQVLTAARWSAPIRFEDRRAFDEFVGRWAIPHARLLARLADASHTWHLRYVDNLATGLFLVGRLVLLAEDVRRDQIFIPQSDLVQAGVAAEELEAGRVSEPIRKLLWKQIVRARDALAQGAPLANDVAPRFSRAIKRIWMGSLELLNEIERRDYDVWASPLSLTLRHRLQVRFQARFGRTTFRK